jgi:hypothetical protein
MQQVAKVNFFIGPHPSSVRLKDPDQTPNDTAKSHLGLVNKRNYKYTLYPDIAVPHQPRRFRSAVGKGLLLYLKLRKFRNIHVTEYYNLLQNKTCFNMNLLHLGKRSHIFSNPDESLFIHLEMKTILVWFNSDVPFRQDFCPKTSKHLLIRN